MNITRLLAIAAVPVLGAGSILLIGVASSFAAGTFAPFIGWGPFIAMLALAIVVLAGFLAELAHRLMNFASSSSRPRRNRRI